MSMNPELQRNLWLELSLHRLLAMPIVLGMLFLLVYLSNDQKVDDSMAVTATIMFILLSCIWGAKQVGDSITREIEDRTWDWQRMSSIGPWSMTWGKLLGSTLFTWYGAFPCLLTYGLTGSSMAGEAGTLRMALLFLSGAVLIQSLVMFATLLVVRQERLRSVHFRSPLYLLVFFLLMVLFPFSSQLDVKNELVWHGMLFDYVDFLLLSLAGFVFWTILGIHRLMRMELQFRNQPWVLLLFVVYLMLYLSGFGEAGVTGRLLTCYVIALTLTYLMVLLEPKDPVAWRRFARAIGRSDWRQSLEQVPRWLLTLLIAVGFTVALVSMEPEFPDWLPSDAKQFAGLILVLLLFSLRDVAIILYLGMAEKAKRPEFAAVLYLLLLYSVAPGILSAIDLEEWTSAFWPRPDLSFGACVLPAAIEVAIMGGLLALRWRSRFGAIG